MQQHFDPAPAPAQRLLVLLPPAEATIDDLRAQGFVAALHTRAIACDVLLAGIDSGHVMARSVTLELQALLAQHAPAGRYREVWIGGISLGAMNALQFAAESGAPLAGLILLAPYPGTRDILRALAAASSPQAWAASPEAAGDDERTWWRWLIAQSDSGAWQQPVYLATGAQDRFLPGQRQLASLLPPAWVHVSEGAHHWPTWQALWAHWLDTGPLAQAHTTAGAAPA